MIKNWAGNLTYHTDRLVTPPNMWAVQEFVRGAKKLKVLGSKHSFNAIADSDDTLLSLEHFTEIGEPDPRSRTVRVGGGVNYGQLAAHLESRGWAVHNLASLPHISVAGACATATHGSGVGNGNLCTALAAMTVVEADGALRTYEGDELKAAAVHLGALGVVVETTLRIEPSYQVWQWVYEGLPFSTLTGHLAEVAGAGYSVSLFTTWRSEAFDQVWVKGRPDRGDVEHLELFGAVRSTSKLHPLPGVSAENCTEQCGIPGPWHERLPHFRMEFMPSAGEELQSEFFVPFDLAIEALRSLWPLAPEIAEVAFVSEIRFIAADDLRMSPAFGRNVVGIHFTWHPNWEGVKPVLHQIEARLAPFGACPHFGKLFAMEPARIAQVYPRFGEFSELAQRVDPGQKFVNEFLARLLGVG